MGELLLGCSGWSYADPAEKGGGPEHSTQIPRLGGWHFILGSLTPSKWIRLFMTNFIRR